MIRAPHLLLVGLLAIVATAPPLFGAAIGEGATTQAPPYLVLAEGVTGTIQPLLTTNDVVGDVAFPSIPDGLGLVPRGRGALDVFVSHEYDPTRSPFIDAQVSRVRLDARTAGVLDAWLVVPDGLDYQRFCSGSVISGFGFSHPLYFANEEVDDGLVVAVDAHSGRVTELPWLGRFAHENTIILPAYSGEGADGRIAVLSMEDGAATESEVYLYVADSAEGFLEGSGQLYVLAASDPSAHDAWDDVYHSTGPVAARFTPVQWDWRTQDAAALHAAADAVHAFSFIRPEDAAVDSRPGHGRTVYMADTGNDRDENGAVIPAGSNGQSWERGRIYEFTFRDSQDPTKVLFQVMIDGNDPVAPGHGLMTNPDNIDTGNGRLLIQEDRIGATRSPVSTPYDTTKNAKVIEVDLVTGAIRTVAYVNQAAMDTRARHGDWESSGIVDASATYGPGAWLLDVQAHSLEPNGPAGQLLLMKID